MTAARDDLAGTEAVVRKPPRKEPAGSEARLLPARYGDLIGAMTAAGETGSAGQVIRLLVGSAWLCFMTDNECTRG